MDYTLIGAIALSVAATLALVFAYHHMKTPAAVAAAEKKLEDYADAELVKLAGDIVAYLSDTTPAQQQIADGQAALARQAQLLAQIQTKFATAKITAA